MYCIDIITLFPDTVGDVLSESILGRAQERDFLRIATHQLRDYTVNKQKQVAGAAPYHLPVPLRQNLHPGGRQAAGLGARPSDPGVRPL